MPDRAVMLFIAGFSWRRGASGFNATHMRRETFKARKYTRSRWLLSPRAFRKLSTRFNCPDGPKIEPLSSRCRRSRVHRARRVLAQGQSLFTDAELLGANGADGIGCGRMHRRPLAIERAAFQRSARERRGQHRGAVAVSWHRDRRSAQTARERYARRVFSAPRRRPDLSVDGQGVHANAGVSGALTRAQNSTSAKSCLPTSQSGQRQLSGTSAQRVPGAMPSSGKPAASS